MFPISVRSLRQLSKIDQVIFEDDLVLCHCQKRDIGCFDLFTTIDFVLLCLIDHPYLIKFGDPGNILYAGKNDDDTNKFRGFDRIVAGTHLKPANAAVDPFSHGLESFHREFL